MPDLGSSVFSQTDGSNNSGTMPSWSGSAAPSTLDDAGRALQGAVTREWNWRNYTLTAAGTADAKTLTYSVAPAAYYNGQRFAFIANTTNTGSATLNVNSLGAKTIKKDVSGTLTNLSASDMVSGMFVEVAYNTSNDCFVWVNRAVITGTANTWSAVQTFNASPIIEVTDNTNPALRITQLGTAPALRVEDSTTPDSSPFMVDASGNVFCGATSAPYAGIQQLVVKGNATNTSGLIGVSQNDDSVKGFMSSFGGVLGIGTETNTPIVFYQNNGEKARFDASYNFLMTASGALGYGTGSGGTVTQITSRTTGVTLNKTNGQITLFSSTTSAGDYRSFTVTNSTVAATDTVIINIASGASADKYVVTVTAVAAGSFRVQVYTPNSVASAEAPVLTFAVIKAVTA